MRCAANAWRHCSRACPRPIVSELLHNLIVFGRLLRSRGLDGDVGRLLDTAGALQHVNLGARDEVFHTCRALLVRRHEDLPIFDAAFDSFWSLDPPLARDSKPNSATTAAVAGASGPMTVEGDAEGEAEPSAVRTWSDSAALAHKDFAAFTPEEVLLARAALDRLVWTPGLRRTRRWVSGRGPRIDLKAALARSVRTGGDVLVLPRRTRRLRPRPIVLLCDVSGSMERYSRMLVHFAHAMAWRHRRVEAFLFSTRLTRITRQLRGRRLDQAVTAVSSLVPDWSGGTRIGGALREFHQQWGRRTLRGGPVVLLISDGWDRGDPNELRDQIARLQRSCHRLIWLNPLIGTTGYEPLTRGLRAALPFVDDFLPARTLTDLADLALHLNTIPTP
jgi:uncharacterized protein with von Willebrand factor type A (vWA) domain